MSVESWKKEFISEDYFVNKLPLGMVVNQLLKFTGCLPENLEKHDVVFNSGNKRKAAFLSDTVSDNRYYFGIRNCKYCIEYYDCECEECPIVAITNHVCYSARNCFDVFNTTGNPAQMLAILEQIKEKLLL